MDSIVDIVAAAQVIALVDARRWSAAPLPLGSGRVRTAHGLLPVPAPATARLLQGLDTIDDGIPGERVTPTGAAVARHLLLSGTEAERSNVRRIGRTGTGFGTRTMPGISNCLRILAFEESGPTVPPVRTSTFSHRELGVIGFEVDDPIGRGPGRRARPYPRPARGSPDVTQSVAFGKKGRIATHVQVLVAPASLDEAIALCFEETATIGLRFHLVQGAALPRSFSSVETDGRPLRVKAVTRPDGTRTAKAEASDIAGQRGRVARTRLRHDAETAALGRMDDERDRTR